ncbi:MAG: hypothetical protein ACI8S6_001983 [Myxococcota bacterium]|jgi:hypothetical protein
MTASYRLIHFTPDPFTGACFPLGAVVADAKGGVRVAKVQRLPSADCLGDRGLAVVIQRLHARLDSLRSAEALPAVFGPYTTLAEPQAIPVGVEDALAWVKQLLNPSVPAAAKTATPRGKNRSSLGFRFFETWRVAPHVRKTFQPASDWGGWLGTHAVGLQQVTHWVDGQSNVLLMEPVVPTRKKFDHDLQDIAAKFLAYRYALEKTESGRQGQLIAYITAGGHPDQRAAARETLAAFAHQVVDTADSSSRDAFLGNIRRIASEGDAQQDLSHAAKGG